MLHYITLSNYLVYASLLSLLQLFFCLHVRLLCAIKYYLLTYLQTVQSTLTKCKLWNKHRTSTNPDGMPDANWKIRLQTFIVSHVGCVVDKVLITFN